MSAVAHRPWAHSTGPRTAAGKAQAAIKGKTRQTGSRSVRELRRDLEPLRVLLRTIREQRRFLTMPTPMDLTGLV